MGRGTLEYLQPVSRGLTVSKALVVGERAEEVLPRDCFGNKAHLMMHSPKLALCFLHFIVTAFRLGYKARISLRSHSFLAVKEGSGLPVSLLLGKELGDRSTSSLLRPPVFVCGAARLHHCCSWLSKVLIVSVFYSNGKVVFWS